MTNSVTFVLLDAPIPGVGPWDAHKARVSAARMERIIDLLP